MKPEIKLWNIISFGPFLMVVIVFAAHLQQQDTRLIAGFVPILVYLFAPLGFIAITFLSLGNKRNEFPLWILIMGVAAQIATYIIVFALYFSVVGLVQSPEGVELKTALYFSVVTWTTLGYGDFQPLPDDRLIAAFSAFMGYFYMALFTGLCIVGFSNSTERYEGD